MTPDKTERDNNGSDELARSKSQQKRDAQAIKSLAAELLRLSASQLGRIPLESDLLLAIQEAREMRSHGARRRQLQYIAKLMRQSDNTAVCAALDRIRSEARDLTARQHRAEAWRDLLIDRGDAALEELFQQRHDLDVQRLRQLIRNARHEQVAGKPPSAARALFRMLRDMDARQALPPHK